MRLRSGLLPVLTLLLAACGGSGNGGTAAPEAVPVETTAITATTAQTATTKATGLGSTQQYESFDGAYSGRITVYRYREGGLLPTDLENEVAKEGQRTVALEVRVCVDKEDPSDPSYVHWAPWSLGDDSGGSYEAWSSYSDNLRAQPLFPDGKVTPPGTCRRGWVPFEVARNAKPTFVEYNTGNGDVLTWPLKR